MIRPPPTSTPTDPLFPYTTLFRSALWQQLAGTERFFLKMVGMEAGGHAKLENYQNFARAFRVPDYTMLMGSVMPNAASLKRRSEEHTSELQSLMRISYAVVCLKTERTSSDKNHTE